MISVFGSKVGAEEIAQVSESINKQWMGMGPKVKSFEEKFSQRLGLNNFALVDSGSNALYLAVTLLDLPKGSEIIIPSFTWVSCAQAILLAGHKPVFCDVDIDSCNVTVENIKPLINSNTKAIMVVHYAGLPVDMDPILELGLPVIEDAAHAVDSYYKGKACGSIGDVGIYSFDAVKNLAVGEGGGIITRKPELAERARILRYCGIGKSGFEASTQGKKRWWEYNIVDAFIKMNPSDISAGIGLAQLEKLDELQAYRKKIWELYQRSFQDIEWIKTPKDPRSTDKHSYFTYFIRVPKRDELASYLFEKGIYTTLRYHPLHMNPIYNSNAKLPNCEQLNEEGLNIPLHPNLSMVDVEKVIEDIISFKNYL
ncbi:MAG: DegT/DnrJ/EryC1/StrS family aminotransferase [Bacillota bacterium]